VHLAFGRPGANGRHEVRSSMYWGIWVSRNSEPVGNPRSLTSSSSFRASRRPLFTRKLPVQIRIVDEPLPPTVVRGFSK